MFIREMLYWYAYPKIAILKMLRYLYTYVDHIHS